MVTHVRTTLFSRRLDTKAMNSRQRTPPQGANVLTLPDYHAVETALIPSIPPWVQRVKQRRTRVVQYLYYKGHSGRDALCDMLHYLLGYGVCGGTALVDCCNRGVSNGILIRRNGTEATQHVRSTHRTDKQLASIAVEFSLLRQAVKQVRFCR